MKRYRITYTNCGETGQVWLCSAYDADHAEERFWDSWEYEGGSAGITIESVQPWPSLQKRIHAFYSR